MNYNEFDLLAKKLEELDLIDEIGNITKWFRRIDKKRLNNIMSLDKKTVYKFKEYKSILVDSVFLSSEFYLNDIEKIKNNNKNLDKSIIELLNNKNFMESNYHEEDLDLILKSKSINCKFLCNVSKSHNSINSKYHKNDMNLIYNCDNFNALGYLSLLSDSKESLNSLYHETDMKIIDECKINDNFTYLYKLATNLNSLNSKYHESDIKVLLNSSYYQSELLKLATDNSLLKSLYHESDMRILSEKASENNIDKLVFCALYNNSKNHNKFMNMILNCDDENKLELIAKLSVFDSINLAMDIEKETNIDKLDLMMLLLSSYEKSKLWIINSIKDKEVIDKLIEYEEEMGIQSFINVLKVIQDKNDVEKLNILNTNLEYIKKNKQKEENLTNKEKINILRNNIYNYVDGDVKKEIPSRVFGLKELRK